MKVVIDIPIEKYNNIVYENIDKLRECVKNGTPIPKGHGDLIDRDKLLERFMESNMTENYIEEMVLYRDRAIIRGQSTIIKADKENK